MKLFLRRFSDLSLDQLYQIIKLRNKVFIIEQNCPFLDLDDQDQGAFHLFLQHQSRFIGYIRVNPLEMDFSIVKLSRFCLLAEYRDKDLGKDMLKFILTHAEKNWRSQEIQISAQEYLEGFYQKFGFIACSEAYEIDNILHINMKKSFAANKPKQ